MNVIEAIRQTPQPLPGARSRRDHVLPDFESFFRSVLPEVRTKYLNSLKEDKDKDAPAKGGRKKVSTSRPSASKDVSEAAPEAVVKKERRTKRKFDHPSVNQEKEVQSVAAATVVVEKVVEEEVVAGEVHEVL